MPKISDLPKAGPLQGNESAWVVQNGVPSQAQVTDILALPRQWAVPLRSSVSAGSSFIAFDAQGVPSLISVALVAAGPPAAPLPPLSTGSLSSGFFFHLICAV